MVCDFEGAGIGFFECAEDVEKCGFAFAGFSADGDRFSFCYGEIDV